jgi:dCMP deaminase
MNWESYAMDLARTAARKSKDPWVKVGACILRHDNTIAALGYNGFPAKMHEDWSDRDERRRFVVHAEQNALRFIKPDEARLIACTLLPCNDCLKSIASYGIPVIIYDQLYSPDNSTVDLAAAFGIELIQCNLA